MRHIHNIPVCHKYKIYHIEFGYDIILDFYNQTLEDVLAHDLVDLTISRKVLKDKVAFLILLNKYIIFIDDIKPRSTV